MSDLPPAGPPPLGPAGFPSAPVSPGPWPPMMPMPRPSRWLTFATLLISLAALGFAVAAWLRPMPEPSPPPVAAAPSFTDQQVADAKGKVCEAFDRLRHALDVNAARNGGDDPNLQLLVAVNDRQIYIGGSAYLLTVISGAPATPPGLAEAVANLAKLYQIITLDFLASEDRMPERLAADDAASIIQGLCK